MRYQGLVIGWDGPPLVTSAFASREDGIPGFEETPHLFPYEVGKTKINPGLDGVIAGMRAGERRRVIVPAALGYGRRGVVRRHYPASGDSPCRPTRSWFTRWKWSEAGLFAWRLNISCTC